VERDDVSVVRLREPELVLEDGRAVVGGVSFNFTSRHQAANAAAALAALDALGLPSPARADIQFSRWRGEERELPGGGLLINDAYNANPVSMRAVLVAVGALARGYVDGATSVPLTRWVPGVPEAIAAAQELVDPGDCVLVKASRAVGLEAVAEALAAVGV
jgi:UDP-N-acetylmuramoyl-tripeptide--D-alanyl-D-alanine ligase